MTQLDKQLMTRYCAGEPKAFGDLYRRVAPKLQGYLTRLTRDPVAAEDLLQMTFLKIHRNRCTYIKKADPMPWIYSIAKRTFLDDLRKRKRAKVQLTFDGELPEIGVPANDGDNISDAAALALEELARLPQTQREAVTLTKIEGHTMSEAARIAGTTTGAMKVRSHRGYAALRHALAA